MHALTLHKTSNTNTALYMQINIVGTKGGKNTVRMLMAGLKKAIYLYPITIRVIIDKIDHGGDVSFFFCLF